MVIPSKACSTCKEIKELAHFHKNKNYSDGYSYKCKICACKHSKDFRVQNIEKSRQRSNERLAERVQWIQNIKSNTPCVDCGRIYPPYCMDYDHVPERGLKIKSVSRMVLNSAPKNRILDEIKKCDLVCVLCHNKRTYDRFNEKLGSKRAYPKWTLRNINLINKFKSKPCYICKKQYQLYNMQVDHINPENKLKNICQLKSAKIKILKNELKKCRPICALCHREKSIKEQKEKKYALIRPKLIVIKKDKIIKEPKRMIEFIDYELEIKKCRICKETKDFELFPFKKNSVEYDTWCLDCMREYHREYKREKNKK